MRVLITGMTAVQCGRPGRYRYQTFATLIAPLLRLAGHEVEQRPQSPGDAMRDYDAVVIGMIKPNSIAAGRRYGALDTFDRAQKWGIPLGLYLDDWRIGQITQGFRSLRDKPERYTNAQFSTGPEHEWALKHLDDLGRISDWFVENDWPHTIAPAFTWGDHSLIIKHTRNLHPDTTTFVDPGAMALQAVSAGLPQPQPVTARQEVHLTAALTRVSGLTNGHWLRERGATWPVELLGTDGEKVTERDVLIRYGEVASTVSLPYPHAGSGWWRNRYDFAPERGCLLITDPAETDPLHPQFALTPAQVEAMTPHERASWVEFQREILRATRQPLGEAVEVASRFVEGLSAAASVTPSESVPAAPTASLALGGPEKKDLDWRPKVVIESTRTAEATLARTT